MKRQPSPSDEATGARGEAIAAAHLRRLGCRVVERNLRTRHGEIDVLARKGRCWIAVEVKASARHPAPERRVDEERLLRMQRTLFALAPNLRPAPQSLQLDLVAVRMLPGARGADRPVEVSHFPAVRAWRRQPGHFGAASTPEWISADMPHTVSAPPRMQRVLSKWWRALSGCWRAHQGLG